MNDLAEYIYNSSKKKRPLKIFYNYISVYKVLLLILSHLIIKLMKFREFFRHLIDKASNLQGWII